MKIPVLGLVVNRTGTDEDQGYYGYHSYGYGYGYNYQYGAEEAREPQPADAQPAAAAEECVPFVETAEKPEEDLDDNEPRAYIVPRRVA